MVKIGNKEVPDRFIVSKSTLDSYIEQNHLTVDKSNPYALFGAATSYFVVQGVIPLSEKEVCMINLGDNYIAPSSDGTFVNDNNIQFRLVNDIWDFDTSGNVPYLWVCPVHNDYSEIMRRISQPKDDSEPIIRGSSMR